MRTTEETAARRLASFGRSDRVAALGFVTFIVLAFLLLWFASSAAAVEYTGRIAGHTVSATAVAPSGASWVLYEAPRTGTFMLTQACSDHTAVYVATSDENVRFTYGNAGCTYFKPGVAVAAGERLRCVNKSGLARSCTIMGVFDAKGGKAVRPKWVESKN